MQRQPHTIGGSLSVKAPNRDGRHSQAAVQNWPGSFIDTLLYRNGGSLMHKQLHTISRSLSVEPPEMANTLRQLYRIGGSFSDTQQYRIVGSLMQTQPHKIGGSLSIKPPN